MKSSIFHNWVRDTRDGNVISAHGALLKLRHEFAGLGGDVAFYKAEAEGQLSRQLLPGIVSVAGLGACPSVADIVDGRRCPSAHELGSCIVSMEAHCSPTVFNLAARQAYDHSELIL